MMANGSRGMLVVKVPFTMLMVISMLVNGSITNAKVMVFILIRKVPDMKATGKTTPSLVKAQKSGQRAQSMWASILMARSRDMEHTRGWMDLSMPATGKTIELMVVDIISGKMVENTMVNGKITICMVQVYMSIQMESLTKGNIEKTRRLDMVSISGQIVASMKVGGIRGNSMAWVFIRIQVSKRSNMGSGSMVSESLGIMRRRSTRSMTTNMTIPQSLWTLQAEP